MNERKPLVPIASVLSLIVRGNMFVCLLAVAAEDIRGQTHIVGDYWTQ